MPRPIIINTEAKVAALLRSLPGHIRIGPFDYAIKLIDANEQKCRGIFGECSTDEQQIEMGQKFASPIRVVDVFLHEVTHAIFHTYCLTQPDDDTIISDEEHIIAPLSTAFAQLYQQNPWLLDWIKSGVTNS